MLRKLAPAILCAGLTLLALLVDLGPPVTVALILLLIIAPACTAWVSTRGQDALTYLGTGMGASAAIAVVGAFVNEARGDDYTTGVVFIGTLLVGLLFTLPPVLIVALVRR